MDFKKMFSQVQSKMDEIKQKKDGSKYTGESGAGMVKITIDGNFNIKEIYIDESLKGEELSIIADLVMAAFNNAKKIADESDEFSESNLMKGFPLPFKPPF
jgi:DNA-binding YbaB/EbfC family protein